MSILLLGINHRSGPLSVLERVSVIGDELPKSVHNLASRDNVREVVVLSTCNRTEIYCDAVDDAHERTCEWLAGFHGLAIEDISPHLYLHEGRHAIYHLLSVASGLDSLVLGEPQILGQVKSAFQTAHDAGRTGKVLTRLFQHAFSTAKQVRTDTAIGDSPVSVAFAAVSLARQIFADLSEQTALLIGAGETVELAARHLAQNGVGRIIVANRTVSRAQELAHQFNAYAISLTEIPVHLAEADIVIASTASPVPVLGKGTVESALKRRRHRPVFMVDIAVPRDIETEVGNLDDIYLYTVDDLQEVISDNMQSRQQAAEQADRYVPLDDAQSEQCQAAQQVTGIDPFPAVSADQAEHASGTYLADGFIQAQACLDAVQRGCHGQGIQGGAGRQAVGENQRQGIRQRWPGTGRRPQRQFQGE